MLQLEVMPLPNRAFASPVVQLSGSLRTFQKAVDITVTAYRVFATNRKRCPSSLRILERGLRHFFLLLENLEFLEELAGVDPKGLG